MTLVGCGLWAVGCASWVVRLYQQRPNFDQLFHKFLFDFGGLGPDFGGSGTPFWEDFEGQGDPWDPLGDPGPPKIDPDRSWVALGRPRGPRDPPDPRNPPKMVSQILQNQAPDLQNQTKIYEKVDQNLVSAGRALQPTMHNPQPTAHNPQESFHCFVCFLSLIHI